MIRHVTLLGLLLAAGLNTTPILTAVADSDCASKRQLLQEKIEVARKQGDSRKLDGLHRALGNVDSHCTDESLHSERLADVEEARQEVHQREMDLRDAMGKGDAQAIAKRQAKLAEARSELQQAEAEARAEDQ